MNYVGNLFPEKLEEAVVWRCSVEKVFSEILQNSQENASARQSLFFNKVAPATLLKRLWHRGFPCNYIKRDFGTGVFL